MVGEVIGEYDCKATAYKALQNSVATREVTPAFYGIWTAETETRVSTSGRLEIHSRRVRFILIEQLEGYCMRDISSSDVWESVRSLILKKVLEAEAILYHAGALHRKFRLRDIILAVSSNYDDPDVVIEHI